MMKRFFAIATVLIFSTSFLFAQSTIDSNGDGVAEPAVEVNDGAGVKFEVEKHNFGEIAQNQPRTYEFVFTNTGTEPLIIKNVRTSCGCTSKEWPKEPIMPGESNVIKATFNAARLGQFNKSITVSTNADKPIVMLYLKGVVVAETSGTPVKKESILANPENKQ